MAHSGRLTGNNPIGVSALPSADVLRKHSFIPDKTFRKMIPPSFHEKPIVDVKTNFDAVLKRTHMSSLCPADEDDVPFYAWP